MIIIRLSPEVYGYNGYLEKDFQIKQPYWYTVYLFGGSIRLSCKYQAQDIHMGAGGGKGLLTLMVSEHRSVSAETKDHPWSENREKVYATLPEYMFLKSRGHQPTPLFKSEYQSLWYFFSFVLFNHLLDVRNPQLSISAPREWMEEDAHLPRQLCFRGCVMRPSRPNSRSREKGPGRGWMNVRSWGPVFKPAVFSEKGCCLFLAPPG